MRYDHKVGENFWAAEIPTKHTSDTCDKKLQTTLSPRFTSMMHISPRITGPQNNLNTLRCPGS